MHSLIKFSKFALEASQCIWNQKIFNESDHDNAKMQIWPMEFQWLWQPQNDSKINGISMIFITTTSKCNIGNSLLNFQVECNNCPARKSLKPTWTIIAQEKKGQLLNKNTVLVFEWFHFFPNQCGAREVPKVKVLRKFVKCMLFFSRWSKCKQTRCNMYVFSVILVLVSCLIWLTRRAREVLKAVKNCRTACWAGMFFSFRLMRSADSLLWNL